MSKIICAFELTGNEKLHNSVIKNIIKNGFEEKEIPLKMGNNGLSDEGNPKFQFTIEDYKNKERTIKDLKSIFKRNFSVDESVHIVNLKVELM